MILRRGMRQQACVGGTHRLAGLEVVMRGGGIGE